MPVIVAGACLVRREGCLLSVQVGRTAGEARAGSAGEARRAEARLVWWAERPCPWTGHAWASATDLLRHVSDELDAQDAAQRIRRYGSAFAVAPAVLVLVLAFMACVVASAQHEDAGLLLARTCVSERGWAVDTDDCSAIYAVALRRVEVRGGTIASALRALSPTLHGDGTVPRDWLQHLERDGRRPRGWRAASWERHRPLWLQTLDEADALLAGERTHRCVELPTSWGSRTDVRVHLAADPTLRWVDVECGNTRNRVGRYERRSGSR